MIFSKFLIEKKLLYEGNGWLARRIRWRTCDVGEAKEKLENELWRRWSNRSVGEWAVTLVKRRKGWRMSCDVGKATEGLENELWRRWSDGSLENDQLILIRVLCRRKVFHCKFRSQDCSFNMDKKRCGIVPLISTSHSLFSIWTYLERSEKVPGTPT